MSEVADFRRQQADEEASSQLGLEGLAVTASHEAINARAEHLLSHLKSGNEDEAYAAWEEEGW